MTLGLVIQTRSRVGAFDALSRVAGRALIDGVRCDLVGRGNVIVVQSSLVDAVGTVPRKIAGSGYCLRES